MPWGLPRHALPAPIASEPRRQPPAGAKEGRVRVPTVAAEDMTEAEAGVYDGLCAANIHRAPSLVPAGVTGFFDPDTVHRLSDAVLRDFGTEYRSLTRLGCSRRAEMVCGKETKALEHRAVAESFGVVHR